MDQSVRRPARLMFDEEKVRQIIRKNQATSYGLTLVIGLPFPSDIGSRVQLIQRQLEALTPGHFFWYGLDHLHATLVAPLRGRYRDHPALQRLGLANPLTVECLLPELGIAVMESLS